MEWVDMRLKILLPSGIFLDEPGVQSLVAESAEGFFGILPNRRDCVAVLIPGLFAYVQKNGKKKYIALDDAILVKTGNEVSVSARHAVGGVDLGQLKTAVEQEFLSLDEQEKKVRSIIARLESHFVRRFLSFQKS